MWQWDRDVVVIASCLTGNQKTDTRDWEDAGENAGEVMEIFINTTAKDKDTVTAETEREQSAWER